MPRTRQRDPTLADWLSQHARRRAARDVVADPAMHMSRANLLPFVAFVVNASNELCDARAVRYS
jgi:hypothetical protein